MRYSWSLQQCNIVTSRFGHKQQMLRKRRMSVLWSRLCYTGTGKMFPEISGGRYMDRIAVLVIGYGHEKIRMFPMAQGAGQALHALI